jgi:hypothetical protein
MSRDTLFAISMRLPEGDVGVAMPRGSAAVKALF